MSGWLTIFLWKRLGIDKHISRTISDLWLEETAYMQNLEKYNGGWHCAWCYMGPQITVDATWITPHECVMLCTTCMKRYIEI